MNPIHHQSAPIRATVLRDLELLTSGAKKGERQILLFRIICIWLSSKFYYLELSVSGYLANFTISASLVMIVTESIVNAYKPSKL